MIDSRQIRAARALLNWTQDTLAKASSIARVTIKNIENDLATPRIDTANALQRVFEHAGIEFLPNSGLRLKDRMIEVYEGAAANKHLIEDIYNTLQATRGELLVAHLDEGKAINDLGKSFLLNEIKKRKAAGITQRLLVSQDDPELIPPFDNYRCLPTESFSPYPMFIFGSKLALLSWNPSPRVVIIDDERFAESARKLFNFVWDRSSMPSYKRKENA